MVEVSGLTRRSVGLEKGENAPVSGELTEAANGEREMEVLLVWTNFQTECQSFQLTADITCEKAAANLQMLWQHLFYRCHFNTMFPVFFMYALVFLPFFIQLFSQLQIPIKICQKIIAIIIRLIIYYNDL